MLIIQSRIFLFVRNYIIFYVFIHILIIINKIPRSYFKLLRSCETLPHISSDKDVLILTFT